MEELTVKQIAEDLDVTTVTVTNYINGDILKAKKKRSGFKFKWVVTRDDFNRFKDYYLSWVSQ